MIIEGLVRCATLVVGFCAEYVQKRAMSATAVQVSACSRAVCKPLS